MKEVKITIDGKEYAKTRPTVLDLRRFAEYQKAMQSTDDSGKAMRRNIAVDEEAQKATFKFIADFVGAPDKKISDSDDLFTLFEAMRTIDANIAEALLGVKPGKNVDGQ